MSDDNSVTFAEYSNEIDNLAEIVCEHVRDYDMELGEAVFEEVDSHKWVMYYSYNTDVLTHAENEPTEWEHMVSDGGSWNTVVSNERY